MPDKNIILILPDSQISRQLEDIVLRNAGYEVTLASDKQAAEDLLRTGNVALVILGDQLEGGSTQPLAASLMDRSPHLPILLLSSAYTDALAADALRKGYADVQPVQAQPEELLQSVRRILLRRDLLNQWARLESRRNTKTLNEKLNGLEALQQVGRRVTASLDLDSVLTAVVDAAVDLTGSEEGSLLLLDESTGELYMRAGRNFQEDFVRTFRLPIRDSLAGQVLRTGAPILINQETPQKIKTSYLVYTLIYVPLTVQGRTIGVLEVDNRHSGQTFSKAHVSLVSTLADYAAIAVENARLYTHSEMERNKLETILTKIEEGVIVVDQDSRLMLINRKARDAFHINGNHLVGKPVRDVVQHPDLLEVLNEPRRSAPCRIEIALEDGRVLNSQVTPIPEVGLVVTMQDITQLKELDRIKSDFVSTVSHDLRSPLTAILGYVELIDRVGPVNEQQREFIHRVQYSVHSITALINDLLDLGRIEAGFDSRKEITSLPAIIHLTVDSLKSRITEKSQEIAVEVGDDLPSVFGNPIHLRQMVANLIGNAVKYTPAGGKVAVRAASEDRQIILQVSDTGPGIPLGDQPFIFDKFYRGSNVPGDTPGSGLGLAIVKSIVENHQGRIWVNSTPGQGTTFTVVLPVAN